MTDEDKIAAMRRELLHDVAEAAHEAQARLKANHTRDWVRGPADAKRISDDFGGCVE